MDGFRDYHTKLARQWKRDILWYHLYVNLKNGYKWTYLQKRNRCTGFEDKLTITKGSRWQGGMDWRSETDICTLRYMEWLANGHLVYSTRNCTQYSVIIWRKTLKEKKKKEYFESFEDPGLWSNAMIKWELEIISFVEGQVCHMGGRKNELKIWWSDLWSVGIITSVYHYSFIFYFGDLEDCTCPSHWN